MTASGWVCLAKNEVLMMLRLYKCISGLTVNYHNDVQGIII